MLAGGNLNIGKRPGAPVSPSWKDVAMRTVPRSLLLWNGLVLGVATILVGTAIGQTKGGKDDVLDEARKKAEVAAQKAESDIRSTLLAAEKLAATDPAKAVDLLKDAKTKLEDTTDLSETRR